jgi:hypothetical protein
VCYGKIQSSYPDQNVYIVGEKTSYGDLCNAFTNGGWYEQASIAKVHSYDCGGCSGSRIDEHGQPGPLRRAAITTVDKWVLVV